MAEPNAYLIPFAPSDASIYEADDTEAAVRKWLAIGHTEELDFLKFRTFESTVRLYAYRHECWDAEDREISDIEQTYLLNAHRFGFSFFPEITLKTCPYEDNFGIDLVTEDLKKVRSY